MTAKTFTLHHTIRVGERFSLDNGRISMTLQEKSGRHARLTLVLHEDVVVDQPRKSANDEGRPPSKT